MNERDGGRVAVGKVKLGSERTKSRSREEEEERRGEEGE
jgi:hypothetical protein